MSKFFLIITVVLLTACGSKKNEPAEAEIKEAIHDYVSYEWLENMYEERNFQYNDLFSIENMRISTQEDIGNKVNPKIVARFTANTQLKQNTYKTVHMLDPEDRNMKTTWILLIEEAFTKGHESNLAGTFEAEIKSVNQNNQAEWNISITDLKVLDNKWNGYPIVAAGEEWVGQEDIGQKVYYVIKGTPNEKSAEDLIQKQELAAIDRQKAWLNSLAGDWVSNDFELKGLNERCIRDIKRETNGEFRLETKVSIPSNLKNNVNTEAKVTYSLPSIGFSKTLPLIVNARYESVKNSNSRRINLKTSSKRGHKFNCPTTQRSRSLSFFFTAYGNGYEAWPKKDKFDAYLVGNVKKSRASFIKQ